MANIYRTISRRTKFYQNRPGFVDAGASTPPRTPGTHLRQYLVSRKTEYLIFPQSLS